MKAASGDPEDTEMEAVWPSAETMTGLHNATVHNAVGVKLELLNAKDLFHLEGMQWLYAEMNTLKYMYLGTVRAVDRSGSKSRARVMHALWHKGISFGWTILSYCAFSS